MQDSLAKCFIRFCRTTNVMMLPLLAMSCWLAIESFPAWRVSLGIVVGVVAYWMLEKTFHVRMHKVESSPFYATHHIHHDHPTPENGCPKLWVMAMYAAITAAVWWLSLPLFSGVWFGILSMLSWYEWFHFLCHCNYSPLTKYGWEVRINHNLHHVHDVDDYYEMLFPKRRTK